MSDQSLDQYLAMFDVDKGEGREKMLNTLSMVLIIRQVRIIPGTYALVRLPKEQEEGNNYE